MAQITSFLRQHSIALLALFVALGGTSYAAVKLPSNSVGSAQIRSGAVNSSEIRGGAVKNGELASGAVTASKIRGNSVTTSKVKAGSLLASDFKAGELPKPAAAPTIPTTLPPSGAAGGALTGTYPNPGLADGSVTASKLGKLPAVRLKFATAGVQTFVSGATTNTGVIFPTTPQYNNGDQFTFGTEATQGGTTLKIPVSGVYSVSAEVLWIVPTTTADNGNGFRSLFLNSVSQPGGVRASSTVPGVTGTATRQIVSTTDYFAAGDEIFLTTAQNSGVDLNIRGSQNQQHFSATLLTP